MFLGVTSREIRGEQAETQQFGVHTHHESSCSVPTGILKARNNMKPCGLQCTALHKYHPTVKKFFLFQTVARVLEAQLNAVTATRHTYKVLENLAFFFLRCSCR